ncbi:MAG TPA: lipid A biosynthesis acyltransferase [Burkholderiales bacterium]|jgi:Kdo2-lipid IVA lauroyltransferase/acyltransferase|nr:lipid A biosynthesis acyltransferase [Burkholderiales bacterium]
MSRLVFAFMWLVRFLPLTLLARAGAVTGSILFWLIPERRKVTRINLEKCFPDQSAGQREALARAHFRAFTRAFIEQGILWWSSKQKIRELVALEGLENLEGHARTIVFAPHFVGFEATLQRLTLDFRVSMMYSRQKDPLFEARLYKGRTRFGGVMLPRQAGIKSGIEIIESGTLYYYLPDLDFGPNRSVFVPFFGVPAATVTGLAYIARTTGAAVVPCVTRMLPGGGYVARLYPAWSDFPSNDDVRDARRMMAFIEERVLEMPEQYFWLHKRFKTRPEGEPRFY